MTPVLRFEIYHADGESITAYKTKGIAIMSPMEVLDSVIRDKKLRREEVKSIKQVDAFCIPEEDIEWGKPL